MERVRYVTSLELRGAANVEHVCTPADALFLELGHVDRCGPAKRAALPPVVGQRLRGDVADDAIQADANQRADGFVHIAFRQRPGRSGVPSATYEPAIEQN